MNKGKVLQVIGPVVDVEFTASSAGERENLPKIYNALEIALENGGRLVLETHQHLGGNGGDQ